MGAGRCGANGAGIAANAASFLALGSVGPAKRSETRSRDASGRGSAQRAVSSLEAAGGVAAASVAGAQADSRAAGAVGVRLHRGPSPSMQAELLGLSPLIAPSALIALERYFQRVVIARKKTAAKYSVRTVRRNNMAASPLPASITVSAATPLVMTKSSNTAEVVEIALMPCHTAELPSTVAPTYAVVIPAAGPSPSVDAFEPLPRPLVKAIIAEAGSLRSTGSARKPAASRASPKDLCGR